MMNPSVKPWRITCAPWFLKGPLADGAFPQALHKPATRAHSLCAVVSQTMAHFRANHGALPVLKSTAIQSTDIYDRGGRPLKKTTRRRGSTSRHLAISAVPALSTGTVDEEGAGPAPSRQIERIVALGVHRRASAPIAAATPVLRRDPPSYVYPPYSITAGIHAPAYSPTSKPTEAPHE